MATVKLKNRRTGNTTNFTLAFFDFDAWKADGNNETEGSIITANTGLPPSVIGSNDKYYVCTVSDAYKYLINTIGLETPDNLIYIEAGTLWKNLFTPTLDSTATTYSTPPAGYNVLGEYWQNLPSNALDGVSQITQGPAAFDITKSWYYSDKATQLFETMNGGYFGVSAFVGQRFISYPRDYTDASIVVGGKQYDFAASTAANRRNNIAWVPSMQDIILDTDAGDYRTTIATVELGDSSEYPSAVCPTKFITTQCIYTTRNGVDYCGAAAITWEYDSFGNLRPSAFTVNFIPLWFWGGITGEFVPDVPVIDQIPANTETIQNGSWTITQSAAGAASIPSVSPLASIGISDSGMHILVCDQTAIKTISDRAWGTISKSVLESFTSGLVSCGFLPYEFIKNVMVAGNAVSACSIGKVQIELPSDGNTHMWIANNNLWVQINAGSFSTSLEGPYKNYLDFEPYTTVSLEIPYCGEISIPASACIDGSIDVVMNCNISNGDVCATVTCTSSTSVMQGTTAPSTPLVRTFYAYGNAFCPMPIVGTDSGISQFVSGFSQTVSGMARIAAGDFSGVGSAAGGIDSMIGAGYQPITGASPIGSKAIIGNKKLILKITRPAPNYTHTNEGYQPYTLEKLTTLSALAQSVNADWLIDNKWNRVYVRDIDLQNSGMIAREQEEMQALLKGGVLV